MLVLLDDDCSMILLLSVLIGWGDTEREVEVLASEVVGKSSDSLEDCFFGCSCVVGSQGNWPEGSCHYVSRKAVPAVARRPRGSHRSCVAETASCPGATWHLAGTSVQTWYYPDSWA